MREIDPNQRPMINDPVRDDPMLDNRRSGLGTFGMIAVLAIILGLGLFAWSAMDNDRVASNATPGVTTGSSTAPTTPAPSPAPGGNATR